MHKGKYDKIVSLLALNGPEDENPIMFLREYKCE
jgi:hypothetical protein